MDIVKISGFAIFKIVCIQSENSVERTASKFV